jgi:hydroxymethylbilane synthase
MSSTKTVLKLGTRRSLLAWSQSEWVAREIERLNPGTEVELVGIETRGDKIQDIPLQAVAGKEFFVAELDEALRSGEVDLTVHSMKDLSLERPEEFVCAAIPRRENPRDVALFGPHALTRLRAGEPLRIGTSSPRRLENIPSFLSRALPQPAPRLEFIEIRGNVNTRLSRVQESLGSERYLDGVILAFAGLIRLWANPRARVEMQKLLTGVRWMVLPLRECPAAPAQGALAVECRAADSATRERISRLHDSKTSERVLRERDLLSEWGGGCHQRFGATAVQSDEVGMVMFVRGVKPDGEFINTIHWHSPAQPAPGASWDGSLWKSERSRVQRHELPETRLDGEAVFIAHSRAVPEGWHRSLSEARLWTSGTTSWFRLAEKGLWVEGCAEGFGFDELAPTLAEPVMGLPELRSWKVITHDRAQRSWESGRPVGQLITTYSVAMAPGELDPEEIRRLREARYIYWSSGSQFDTLRAHVSVDAQHACGAGKTARHLRSSGVEPLVFPSVEEWRKWLRT